MLKTRSTESEIMDDLSLGGQAMERTLEELEVINRRLGGNTLIRDGLDQIYKNLRPDFPKEYFKNNPLTIADFGCGGGDLLVEAVEWARSKDIPVRAVGFDANEHIIRYATNRCNGHPEIELRQQDIFDGDFKLQQFDIITCSFFCHHFSDEQLVQLFRQLYQQSNHAILINDLHRHWLAYYSIKWLTHFFSKSYLVKNDAAVSVARAFTKNELKKMLDDAGINNYTLQWKWAFRFQLVIYENKY